MSSIAELIQKEIESLSTDATQTNVGRIMTLADGVARVDGLSKVMFNEMIVFPGDIFGIALNLEEDSVGCVILGDASSLKEGDEVQTTGRLLSVPVGMGLLGRVVDAIGRPVDEKGPLDSDENYPVERIAPGIIPRQSVDQPLTISSGSPRHITRQTFVSSSRRCFLPASPSTLSAPCCWNISQQSTIPMSA